MQGFVTGDLLLPGTEKNFSGRPVFWPRKVFVVLDYLAISGTIEYEGLLFLQVWGEDEETLVEGDGKIVGDRIGNCARSRPIRLVPR